MLGFFNAAKQISQGRGTKSVIIFNFNAYVCTSVFSSHMQSFSDYMSACPVLVCKLI